jgi:hypothetical protein
MTRLRRPALPPINRTRSNVRLGVLADAFLDGIGEFRPGEAWEECADRLRARDPELAYWLVAVERRWAVNEAREGRRDVTRRD